MARKASVTLIAVSLISVLFVSGCGPSGSLCLKFAPEQTAAYQSTTEIIKDYRFDQPTLGKLKEEQTKTLVVMDYSQTIENVDESGNATAKITLNQLKVDITNKNETRLAFDSRNEADKNAPLSKLIGKSYTIRIV